VCIKNNLLNQLNKIKINKAFIVFTVLIVINGFFYHKTLSADRDYGGYVVNSVFLAKSNSLINHDSELKHPGFGVNINSKVTMGKLPLYGVYLASFYKYFGLTGLFYANSFLQIILLINIFLISKKISNKKSNLTIAIWTFLIYFISYPTLYFTRRTLSENLIITLSSVLIFYVLSRKNIKNLIFVFTIFFLCITTRSDSVFLIPGLLYYFASFLFSKIKNNSKLIREKDLIPILMSSILMITFVLLKKLPPIFSMVSFICL
jgi:hypothetical protein